MTTHLEDIKTRQLRRRIVYQAQRKQLVHLNHSYLRISTQDKIPVGGDRFTDLCSELTVLFRL